jgi:NDP-sugar pyrophosphorylase family protein
MCGGYGSRLKPYTYLIPKPFLTSNDISPFDYSLKNIFKLNAIKKIFVTTHYKSNLVKKIIKKKKIPNLTIITEEKPLGTAGSLRIILKKSNAKYLLVINGDVFSKVNYKKIIAEHIRAKKDLTACVKDYDIKLPYAVLTKDINNNLSFKEKPTIKKKINVGMYVLSTKFLKKFFKNNKDDFIGMDKVLKYTKKINVYEIGDKWIDIGHINDFKKAYNEIKKW